MFNTTGILLTQNGSQVSAIFDGTVAISVIALSNILHASTSLPEEYRNHTEGLLGKKWSSDRTPAAVYPVSPELHCGFSLGHLGLREGSLHPLFRLISCCLPSFQGNVKGAPWGRPGCLSLPPRLYFRFLPMPSFFLPTSWFSSPPLKHKAGV